MTSRAPLAALFVLVTGCASAPPPVGESGLTELRQALDLLPTYGRVERGPDGAWLVDRETGTRLLRLPELTATCALPTDYPAPYWRLYEGDPGAALGFHDDHITLWSWSAGLGCKVATPVFVAPAMPAGERRGEASWSHGGAASKNDGAKAEPETETVSVPLDLDGRRGGATATLTEDALTIVGADGEVLFTQPISHEGPNGCGSTSAGQLESARRDDGTTLVHLQAQGHATDVYDESESCDDPPRDTEDSLDLWVAFAPKGGAATVLSLVTSQRNELGASIATTSQSQPVPGGMLSFDMSSEDAGAQERSFGGPTITWSWTFVPTDGDPVTLAAQAAP